MTAADAIIYSIIVCLAGSLVSLITSRSRSLAGVLAFIATAGSGAFAFYAAYRGLTHEAEKSVSRFASILHISVDGLSSIFLGLIALISILAAFYSISYMRHYFEYGAGRYYPWFLLFVAGMYGIVTTTDMMWVFCSLWQLMTVPSFLLVRYEYRKIENVRAAFKYLAMMEVSCAFIMLGAYVLGRHGAGYDFNQLSEHIPVLLSTNAGLVTLALFFFLIGFGIKAGMWPFGQLWLPDAHPAAPSPVSALLSGVMIKTGIYGLMRSFIWLIPISAYDSYPCRKWGLVISILGAITLFIGTMQALKQEQTKRLLAFHSIGQIGYILLGLGCCLSLLSPPLSTPVFGLAILGFYGALFHTINHGLFKSLLFLNAGSMLHATGTQDLNKLGGLMKYMKITAITALIASFSIAGVPLFNGFASKWTIYVSAILGSHDAKYLAICAVIAILTSALTLASFIKFFGISFLSRESQLVTEKIKEKSNLEADWFMKLPQLFLAVACLALGSFPFIAFTLIRKCLTYGQEGLAKLLIGSDPTTMTIGFLGISTGAQKAILAPFVMGLVMVLMIMVARMISRLGGAERRVDAPWLCGYANQSDANRYKAHGLYMELKRYFGWVGGKPKA